MQESIIGYDYQDITVKRVLAPAYADGYVNFGWRLDATREPTGKVDAITLQFKRDHALRNKLELSRLQHQFDTCLAAIGTMETAKTVKASVAAYAVGLAGTACMAGSVFALLAGLLPLSIVLAIPGFAGWGAAYYVFQRISRQKTQQVTPLIDQKYDEAYSVCQRANDLLGA